MTIPTSPPPIVATRKNKSHAFKVIEFSGLFHVRTLMGSNETEISHGRV